MLAVAAAYYALAWAGLTIALAPSNASPMWPAAGFALAAVLLWGPRAAFGVFLGAWLANDLRFLADRSAAPAAAMAASALIGLGNSAEALLGAALLRRLGPPEDLSRRTRAAALFCALAPVIAQSWSIATAYSLLAWYVFAPQCMSTLAVVRRETNSWRYPLIMAGYLFALAYIASFITYRVTLWLGA